MLSLIVLNLLLILHEIVHSFINHLSCIIIKVLASSLQYIENLTVGVDSPLCTQHCGERLVSMESVNLVSMLCIFNAIHALRDKVPLRLLKLYFYIVDVAEWSKALDIRLQAIGAVVYQRCAFEFRRGKTKYLSAQKSNSKTVLFNFQTYVFIIDIVSS